MWGHKHNEKHQFDLKKRYKKHKNKNLLSHRKMSKQILTFGDIKIENNKFYCKYFISYFYNNHKVKSLHIMLPKTSAYVNKLS